MLRNRLTSSVVALAKLGDQTFTFLPVYAAAIADQQASGRPQNPSLIICPSTLVPHWAYEISKFVAPGLIQPLQYQGTPRERQVLQPQLLKHNVVVASYESVKADVDWLAKHTWLYCVLDEGHIIRNPKNRITQVSSIHVEHFAVVGQRLPQLCTAWLHLCLCC